MSLQPKKRMISEREYREEVEKMILARKKASSRVMSREEFLRQCPEEVRVDSWRVRKKSVGL